MGRPCVWEWTCPLTSTHAIGGQKGGGTGGSMFRSVPTGQMWKCEGSSTLLARGSRRTLIGLAVSVRKRVVFGTVPNPYRHLGRTFPPDQWPTVFSSHPQAYMRLDRVRSMWSGGSIVVTALLVPLPARQPDTKSSFLCLPRLFGGATGGGSRCQGSSSM